MKELSIIRDKFVQALKDNGNVIECNVLMEPSEPHDPHSCYWPTLTKIELLEDEEIELTLTDSSDNEFTMSFDDLSLCDIDDVAREIGIE